MATNEKNGSDFEKVLPPELQTDQEGFEPGLDLSQSEIEDVIKFMREDLGVSNPLDSKK